MRGQKSVHIKKLAKIAGFFVVRSVRGMEADLITPHGFYDNMKKERVS